MPKEQNQRQFNQIHELLDERDISRLPENQRRFLSDRANIQRMNYDQTSNAIGVLLRCPRKGETVVTSHQHTSPHCATCGKETQWPVQKCDQCTGLNKVIQGRYFIVDPKDNVEKFIHVDKPTEGNWKGYTFVKVRASDDLYPIRDRQHREMILVEIAKDPVTAMSLYGEKLGVCGRCGRTLTQIDSRLRGLGPICAGKVREEYGMELNLDNVTNLLNESD